MKLGIVGLPNVGKSTLFNALTSTQNAQAANYPFCTIEPNSGIVPVPDARLDKLAEIWQTDKKTPAIVEFVDIAGLVKGASQGAGLGNKFLGHIRECDAIVHVVRCFDDDNIIHVVEDVNKPESVDPIRDIDAIDLELILADLEVVSNRLGRQQKAAKTDNKTAAAEASVRHYESSRAMSMAGENVPGQVYDNLVATVRKHLPDMYRYVALRKRILGVDELHYYDVYAPLTKGVSAHYTYDQAKQMVLDAVAPLGEEYGTIVRKGFAERWIDVFPNKGKSGGAYSGGSYDSNPYIMCNFTGTLDSVSTIAHEMGHSMHSWFSRHTQPAQYADYTLFVAEVASTVNENLLIEHLLAEKNQDPATRLALLNQYLENFKGTVYRQTMFAEFERDAHAMAERGEALNPAALNSLYKKLIVDYFGPELVVDDEVQYEWARIPHFYRPFYVYKYATGYSTAVALSEGILKNGEPAVKKYLEFLHMGGSAYPLDELRHAGVDLTTPAPVDAALDKFGRILDEAEACVAQLEAAK